MADLQDIEGIGPAFAAKLKTIGINSIEELLEKGAHTRDREEIAEKSGLTYAQILEWVNRADLDRIRGIGSEYADLLESAGVDTVPELARRRADNLTAKLAEVNQKGARVRRVPTEAEVADWIAQAGNLERKVFYEARSRPLPGDTATAAPAVIGGTIAVASDASATPPPLPPSSTMAEETLAEETLAEEALAEDEPETKTDEVIVPLATAAALGTAATMGAGGAAAAAALAAGAIPPVMEEPDEDDEAAGRLPLSPTATTSPAPLPAASTPASVMPLPSTARMSAPAAAAPAGSEDRGGMGWLWTVGALICLGLLGWLLWPKGGTTIVPVADTSPVATVSSPLAAATPAPAAVTAPVITEKDIILLYDGGTKDWIVPAADAFNKGRTEVGRIYLNAMGSREGRDNILYQKDRVQPVLWSPSDAYWVDKLKLDATNANLPAKSGATVGDSKPLARTYLVFLMPEAKAKVLEAAAAQPAYQGKTWALLRTLATKGWGAVGGPAEWGKLKMAQTDPTRSNSAMTALTLMYTEFATTNPGKSINDPVFLQMMGDIEGSVSAFAPSTSDLMKAFLSKDNREDIAIVYESEAIKAMEGGAEGLRIVYPGPTVAVTVPVAEVKAKWVSDDRAKLAAEFLEYLGTDAAQEKALAAGYRPVSATLAIKVRETIAEHAAHGTVEVPKALEKEADTKTKEGLIYNWDQWHKKRGA